LGPEKGGGPVRAAGEKKKKKRSNRSRGTVMSWGTSFCVRKRGQPHNVSFGRRKDAIVVPGGGERGEGERTRARGKKRAPAGGARAISLKGEGGVSALARNRGERSVLKKKRKKRKAFTTMGWGFFQGPNYTFGGEENGAVLTNKDRYKRGGEKGTRARRKGSRDLVGPKEGGGRLLESEEGGGRKDSKSLQWARVKGMSWKTSETFFYKGREEEEEPDFTVWK